MMHYTEKTLLSIFNTIAQAGIRTSSMLQAQPKLREMFFGAFRNWMERIPLRTAKNVDILRRLGLEAEDASGDILRKLMRQERRVTMRERMTYKECLNEALHPQLDLVLACHADNWQKDPKAVIRYLVAIVNRYCVQLVRDRKLHIVLTDPEQMPRYDANAVGGAVGMHAVSAEVDMTCEKQFLLTAFACFNGKDFLRDISILARKACGMPCETLEQLLLAGRAKKLARELVDKLSSEIGVDCSDPEVLGRFLEAAERFRLPEEYYTNTKALRKKLYDATASKMLGKIMEQAKKVSA